MVLEQNSFSLLSFLLSVLTAFINSINDSISLLIIVLGRPVMLSIKI